MTDFSDPKWWPQRPPPAPKRLTLGMVLLAVMLPLVVTAAVVLLIVTAGRSHPAADRTQAAYNHCLLTHAAAGSSPSTQRQAAADCQGLDPVPSSPQRGGFAGAPGNGAEAEYRNCLIHAIGALPHHAQFHGRGYSDSVSRSSAQSVAQLCAQLVTGHLSPVGPGVTTSTVPPKL